ncbi:hypothetical protein Zm00014a_009419, partial [Zea mays]
CWKSLPLECLSQTKHTLDLCFTHTHTRTHAQQV